MGRKRDRQEQWIKREEDRDRELKKIDVKTAEKNQKVFFRKLKTCKREYREKYVHEK